MSKQILYLTYDGLTDPLGKSQILPYVKGLNKNEKFKFTIISFEKKQYDHLKKSTRTELLKNDIAWISLNYSKKPRVLSALYDIYKLKKSVKKSISNSPVDLIHCRSYITSLIGLNFKNTHNIPFIFDMRGFWSDERIDGQIWNLNNIIYKKIYNFFKRKEVDFLQNSDYTISLTKAGKKEIESWKIPNLSPIKIIPCCADEKLFQEKNVINIRAKLGIKKGDFILSYVGSTGTWYMLEEMLDFFLVLLKRRTDAKFLFITKDKKKIIFEKAKSKGIEKSKILVKSSTREMMPSHIKISNLSIFFIKPLFSKKASSPTKMGEIMNLGVPIICNTGIGDVDEIMKKCMPELIVRSFSNEEYNRVLNSFFRSKYNFDNIIKTSKDYYSLSAGTLKYKEIYQQLLFK